MPEPLFCFYGKSEFSVDFGSKFFGSPPSTVAIKIKKVLGINPQLGVLPGSISPTFKSLPENTKQELAVISREYSMLLERVEKLSNNIDPDMAGVFEGNRFIPVYLTDTEKSARLRKANIEKIDLLAFALFKYKCGVIEVASTRDFLSETAEIDEERMRLLKKQSAMVQESQGTQKNQQQLQKLIHAYQGLLTELGTLKELNRTEDRLLKKLYDDQKKIATTFYGVKNEKGEVWCAILHRYGGEGKRRMGHLIPRQLKHANLAQLLGVNSDSGNLLFDKKMVLFMDSRVEEYYDRGQLTIIPTKTQVSGRPIELEVVLVDRGIQDNDFGDVVAENKGRKFKDLDGQVLQFLNDERPSLRTLYIHAVISFHKCERRKWATQSNLRGRLFTGMAWGTPGGIGLDSILGTLAADVGDQLVPMIAASSFVDKPPLEQIFYRLPPPEEIFKNASDLADIIDSYEEGEDIDPGYDSPGHATEMSSGI